MGNKTITILDNFNYCLNQAKQATFYKYRMGGKWEHCKIGKLEIEEKETWEIAQYENREQEKIMKN